MREWFTVYLEKDRERGKSTHPNIISTQNTQLGMGRISQPQHTYTHKNIAKPQHIDFHSRRRLDAFSRTRGQWLEADYHHRHGLMRGKPHTISRGLANKTHTHTCKCTFHSIITFSCGDVFGRIFHEFSLRGKTKRDDTSNALQHTEINTHYVEKCPICFCMLQSSNSSHQSLITHTLFHTTNGSVVWESRVFLFVEAESSICLSIDIKIYKPNETRKITATANTDCRTPRTNTRLVILLWWQPDRARDSHARHYKEESGLCYCSDWWWCSTGVWTQLPHTHTPTSKELCFYRV